MSYSLIEVEYEPPLATLSMKRPQVLNAFNEELLDQLKSGIENVLKEEKIKAVIITGSGLQSFCVGADLDWLEKLDSDKAREISEKGNELCDIIEDSNKAVIASVNGYALGGGMEIALACDLRIASTRARFGQPEVSLGLIPGFGGTQRLSRVIGVSKAKEMLFTGELIDAERAYEIGLVNRLVTPRDLLKESQKLARKISEQSSAAVNLIKNAIRIGREKGGEAEKKYEQKAFSDCFKNQEHFDRIKKRRQELDRTTG